MDALKIIRLVLEWIFGRNSEVVKQAEQFNEVVEADQKESGSVELHDSYERQKKLNEEEAWRRQKAREQAEKGN